MATIQDMVGRYDLFWVFVPQFDSWRLGLFTNTTKPFVVILTGSLWTIYPNLSYSWEAVGIEMPPHPRSVTIPK